MPDIKELLEGRSDLSTYLIHFTRLQDDGTSGRDVLLRILKGQLLRARHLHGIGKGLVAGTPFEKALSVICMSEAPLDHCSMLSAEIPGRSWRFAPYGLVFTKEWAREWSFNPVWYLNTTRGQDWLTTPLNELADLAMAGRARTFDAEGSLQEVGFAESQVAKLLPFIETAGVGKDFSWEREWRRVGSLAFLPRETVAVLAPEEDHVPFRSDYERMCMESGREPSSLRFLDSAWPLARMKAQIEA